MVRPPAPGLTNNTGAIISADPSATTTYTVTAINPANSQSGSTTVTLNINSSSYSLATASPGIEVCQNKSVVAGTTYFRDGNCNLIASIQPAGANPVANSINSCVTVNSSPGKLGTPDFYLARKYDIQPIVDAANAALLLCTIYKVNLMPTTFRLLTIM